MAGRHPYDPDVAVRLICWFPASNQVVLALVGFDKKPGGGHVLHQRGSAR